VATIVACTGFEFGASAGLAVGNAGNKVFDTSLTPTIVASSPRSGGFCLELSSTSATRGVGWTTATFGTSKTHIVGQFCVYFPTSLPAANTDLFQFQCVGPNYVLRYRSSDSTLVVDTQAGGATTVGTGSAVTTNTWYRIDFHIDVTNNPHVISWKINDVDQTAMSNASAADTMAEVDLGWTLVAATATVHFDDWLISVTSADYPLGAHKVLMLSVDPADTFTVNGATTNWNTFAGATPTETAWNATTARDNTDEIPVGVGASQDGFQQIVISTTAYVQCPLTTYTLAGGESVGAARMLIPGWAASTTAATIGFRSWNGTTETTLFAAADPNFDNSSTPGWVCKMLTLADVDTQAELDALAIRVGFSGDVTPHIGVHAVYVELAVKESTSISRITAPVKPWQPIHRAAFY
jgi:hypothetical protein